MARDLVCAAVLLCVAAAYYAGAAGISRSTLADEVGAQGLPMFYAALLALVALLLGAKTLLRARLMRRPAAGAPPAERERSAAVKLKRASGLLAIGIGYVVIVPLLGYLVAVAMTLAATAAYEGQRASVRLALFAVGGAVFLWLLFDRLLGIGMPPFAAW